MVATALFLIATGAAVVVGWQPMPDGSSSYEVIVQLEPELASDLQRGKAMPVSVEVPEDIGPVGRIRVVVGRNSLPQQRLVTEFKPVLSEVSEKLSREGIVETQFTQQHSTQQHGTQQHGSHASDHRYGGQQTAPQQILPPGDYGTHLQNAAQQFRGHVTEVSSDILPPNAGRDVAGAMRNSAERLGNDLQNASQDVRADIRQLFGGSDQSPGGSSAQGSSQQGQVLPPSSSPPANSAGNDILPPSTSPAGSQVANGTDGRDDRLPPQSAPHQPRQGESDWRGLDQVQSGNWPNQTDHIGPPSGSGRDSFAESPSIVPQQQAPVGDRYETTPSNLPIRGSNVVPDNVRSGSFGDFSSRNGEMLYMADERGTQAESGRNGNNNGPNFPAEERRSSEQQHREQHGDFAEGSGQTNSAPRQQSNVPEINRGMLSQPANAELQASGGQTVPPHQTNQGGQQQLAQHASAGFSSPSAAEFGWDNSQQTQPQQNQQQPHSSDSVFALLLSWVLLSGSVVGNVYLIWNYLDVRNKYRDVVHDASRKISRRFAV